MAFFVLERQKHEDKNHQESCEVNKTGRESTSPYHHHIFIQVVVVDQFLQKAKFCVDIKVNVFHFLFLQMYETKAKRPARVIYGLHKYYTIKITFLQKNTPL